MYDIAIIGAGPAGTTLARLLGSKYKILLVDKNNCEDTSQDFNPKCCGGLLAPDAQGLLSQLGLGLPKEVLVSPQIFLVRTMDMQSGRECFYRRHYINIHRRKFDAWLFSLVPKQVRYLPNTLFRGHKEDRDGLALELRQGRKNIIQKARVLVGADGARSMVRKMSFPGKTDGTYYFALQEWFKVRDAAPYFSAIFDTAVTDFYAWTIPKQDELLVGAALAPGDPIYAKFSLFLEKLRARGFSLEHPHRRKGAFLRRPVKTAHLCTGAGSIALVGEAAGWISPSSAEGLSYAFRSALYLAQALWQGLDGFSLCYRKKCGPLFRNIFLKRLKSPFMYNTTLRNLILRTGVRNVKLAGEFFT